MIDPNNICMGCMREKTEAEICPHCGFSMAEYNKTRSPRVLPPYTILNGKYLLGRVLGEGGFGITYLALDLNLQIPLAIKEYFPTELVFRDTKGGTGDTVSLVTGKAGDLYAHGLESFTSEAKTLARFHGMEGIVSVSNFFFENGTGYLVMDYIRGKTLREYLKQRNNRISQQETLECMHTVLTALGKVHEEGMIHRDISPDNIMLSDTGHVYLIDFGAARNAAGVGTKSLTVLLKHGYAPVEQYQSKGRQGPWTDVYGVCATMYRMISGNKPEAATDRVQKDTLPTLEQLAAADPGIKVSPQVSKAIEKGMEIRGENRYQDMESLMWDLYGTAQTKKEQSETKATKALPIKKKTGILAIAAAAFALILVMLTAGFFLLRDEKEESGPKSGNQEPLQVLEIGERKDGTAQQVSLYLDKGFSSMERTSAVMASITSTDQLDGTAENSPMLMFDGDRKTMRYEVITGGRTQGEKVTAFLGKETMVQYLALYPGNWKSVSAFHEYNRPKTLELVMGDMEFTLSLPEYEYGQEFCLEFSPPVLSSSFSVQTLEVYQGKSRGENCITDILVYSEESND